VKSETARDKAASERVDPDVGAMGHVFVIIQRRVFNEVHGNLPQKYQLAQTSIVSEKGIWSTRPLLIKRCSVGKVSLLLSMYKNAIRQSYIFCVATSTMEMRGG
jgi:hypothetical protein